MTCEYTSFRFVSPNLDTTVDHCVASPKFTCNGHQWQLEVYPGGSENAAEGKVSIFLTHLSEGTITATFIINVINFSGKIVKSIRNKEVFDGRDDSWGRANFISLSKILYISRQPILDLYSTLTIDVYIEKIEESTTAFVPKNPFANILKEMFNDEDTADICFEVSTSGEKEDNDGNKRVKTATQFYAHRLILQKRAHMLAAICGSNDSGGVVTATVNDISPHIFRHLLAYVYGGTISEKQLKKHAKDIIDAADKYSIVNLKLAAEAAYVESTDISLDNAMDNLLYADSRNLALLKEAVMNFFADNHFEAAAHISFTDCPSHVMKDLLIAFGRKDMNGTDMDELTTLSVTALRKKLHKMGKDVDGSREAMIESIKTHSKKSLAKLARAGVYDAELSDSESESEEESESSESESEEE